MTPTERLLRHPLVWPFVFALRAAGWLAVVLLITLALARVLPR